jgi:peptide deformylase
MSIIGIVQDPDPVLRQVAVRFDLPAEAAEAYRVVEQLQTVMRRAARIHRFTTGFGVAAPQVRLARAAAVVQPADGDVVTLLNPRIVEQSAESDEQYEGCWSFFDVRGKVTRPLCLHVEYEDLDGTRRVLGVEREVARLVAHEVDHLHGVLYVDRMPSGHRPVHVSEYLRAGH